MFIVKDADLYISSGIFSQKISPTKNPAGIPAGFYIILFFSI